MSLFGSRVTGIYPMNVAESDLLHVALQVSDGLAIDWTARASGLDPAERDCLTHLQQIEALARVHAPASDCDSDARLLTRPDTPPARWGSLDVVERIGGGAYGDVYRAHDARLGRDVALKLLHDRDSPDDPDAAPVEEGRLLARVRHPNVVTVYGAERIDGRTGLWMEFVEGETLEQELRRRGSLPATELVQAAITLGSALASVHAAGLLHRDIKASNVMRARDGRLVLMDFGAGADHAIETDAGSRAGTPLYVAPEVLSGGPAGIQSDVYSLGVLLWHLATGSYPVTGQSLADLRNAHARGIRQELRILRADVPRGLARLIERAVSPEPSGRPSSSAELEAEARRLADAPRRRRFLAAAAAVAAAMIASVAQWGARAPGGEARARLGFEPRDFVLVTRFENQTGEPVFDGAIEYALERELSMSDRIGLAPPQRVQDALELMKRPLDTVVTRSVGREVALRDGRIKALLSGRIERHDNAYILTAHIVDPGDGSIVATHTEEATGQGHVAAALARTAEGVRSALGEQLPRLAATGAPAQAGATPSLRAFQLYNQAYQLGREGQWPVSLALAREIVREDPEFASGWMWLAWALYNTDGPREEVLAAADRARSLAATAPDWERFWIEGSHATLVEDPARSIAPYQALLRLRPDHYYAARNLNDAFIQLGRYRESGSLFARLADLRPLDARTNMQAAAAVLAATREVDAARAYVERTRTVVAERNAHDAPEAWWVTLFDAYADWRRRNLFAAAQKLDTVSRRILDGGEPHAPTYGAGTFHLALGQIERAEAVLAMRAGPRARLSNALTVAVARDDRDGLRYQLQRLRPAPELRDFLRPTLYLRAGLVRQARQLVAGFMTRPDDMTALAGSFQAGRGEIALLDGKVDLAIDAFGIAVDELGPFPQLGDYQLACRGLARALDRAGRRGEAIVRLEACAANEPYLLANGYFGTTHWIETRLQLADEYRRDGRLAEAGAIEQDVRVLLGVADVDHPLVVRLRTRH